MQQGPPLEMTTLGLVLSLIGGENEVAHDEDAAMFAKLLGGDLELEMVPTPR